MDCIANDVCPAVSSNIRCKNQVVEMPTSKPTSSGLVTNHDDFHRRMFITKLCVDKKKMGRSTNETVADP